MWTLVGIGSGAVCMLVGVIFGVALCEYKKDHDGFLILAKILEEMSRKEDGRLHRRGCMYCDFVAKGEILSNVGLELRHHVTTRHPEGKNDVASDPVSA